MKKLFFLSLLCMASFLVVVGIAGAQDAPVCPTEVACPEIVLSPDNLIGDFFIGDQQVAGGTNRATLQIPAGQAVTVTIRNIQSPGEAGFNELFVYQEATVNVNLRGGQTRQYTASPRREFIRGTLDVTCSPRNVREGEDVACNVIVDGAGRGVVPAGQSGQFIVDGGSRALRVELVGGSAGVYAQNANEQTVSVTAGRTRSVRVNFDRAPILTVTLNQAGVVGDIFLNDQLIAGQVNTTTLQVVAGQPYSIRVTNIVDPSAVGAYVYQDVTSSVTLRVNQERTVTMQLRRQAIPQPTTPPAARPVPGSAASCNDGSFDFAVCQNYQTPANCDQAVAMGIPERDVACCFPARDRDNDGVACYGN